MFCKSHAHKDENEVVYVSDVQKFIGVDCSGGCPRSNSHRLPSQINQVWILATLPHSHVELEKPDQSSA